MKPRYQLEAKLVALAILGWLAAGAAYLWFAGQQP